MSGTNSNAQPHDRLDARASKQATFADKTRYITAFLLFTFWLVFTFIPSELKTNSWFLTLVVPYLFPSLAVGIAISKWSFKKENHGVKIPWNLRLLRVTTFIVTVLSLPVLAFAIFMSITPMTGP